MIGDQWKIFLIQPLKKIKDIYNVLQEWRKGYLFKDMEAFLKYLKMSWKYGKIYHKTWKLAWRIWESLRSIKEVILIEEI